MPRRIKATEIRARVIDAGLDFSEFDGGDWDPGFRVEQSGPRQVHVFYDGPGEADQLEAFTSELRGAGYCVVATQQDRGGRRRLEVTLP
ncbi:hypothetical protein ACIOWI_29590 [Streptomyces sp. NPDC087659]|uniref:hypothetical protein n=1 Tax=Streptomyces sp. NPDC087659 TaxID=3365801 RepID=UPI00380090DC